MQRIQPLSPNGDAHMKLDPPDQPPLASSLTIVDHLPPTATLNPLDSVSSSPAASLIELGPVKFESDRSPDNVSGANSEGSSSKDRKYRPQKFCAVCGDKAIACNFNAVTCESCKAFFRRNAFKEQHLKCLFNGKCEIDRNTRRFCSKCRLMKCFQTGMKREWILTEEQKHFKRNKIIQNRLSKQLTTRASHSASATTAPVVTNPPGHSGEDTSSSESVRTEDAMVVAAASSRGRVVETRDVGVSCSPESDFLAPICSLALQCHGCYLRATCCPQGQADYSAKSGHPISD